MASNLLDVINALKQQQHTESAKILGEVMSPKPSSKEIPKVVVVGAGIAGLSAAFSHSLLGHNVLVIDNRAEYTRDQRIFLPNDLVEQFYSISDLPELGITIQFQNKTPTLHYPENFEEPKIANLDLNFFRLLVQCQYVVLIKDFQKYQLQKFKNLLTKQKFNYTIGRGCDNNNTLAANRPFYLKGNVEFLMGPQYMVLAIDGKRQILRLETDKEVLEIPFTQLIAADGSNHAMANLFMANNPQYRIPTRDLESPRHNAYGVGFARFFSNTLEIDTKEKKDQPYIITPHLEGAPKFKLEDVDKLLKAGWKEDYFPFIYISIDMKTRACYITGEIPPKCASLSEWFKTVIQCLTEMKDYTFAFYKSSSFQVKTKSFKTNYIHLDNFGQFILLGDAFLPANFLYGHGVAAAIRDGNAIFESFDQEGEFDPEKLEAHMESRFEEYDLYKKAIEKSRQWIKPQPILQPFGPQPLPKPNSACNDEPDIRRLFFHYQRVVKKQNLIKDNLFYNTPEMSWLRRLIEQKKREAYESRTGKQKNAFALVPYKGTGK